MNRQEFESYLREEYGSMPEYLFEGSPDCAVYRHADNRKWFCIIMTVPKKKFGIDCDESVDVVNLKCSQEIISDIVRENGIFPAYHMNKNHWVSVLLDGSVDGGTVRWLTRMSFELTKKKVKIKQTQSR